MFKKKMFRVSQKYIHNKNCLRCLLFGVGVNIKGEGIMQLFCMNAYILVSALAAKFTVDFTVLHSV